MRTIIGGYTVLVARSRSRWDGWYGAPVRAGVVGFYTTRRTIRLKAAPLAAA